MVFIRSASIHTVDANVSKRGRKQIAGTLENHARACNPRWYVVAIGLPTLFQVLVPGEVALFG